MLIVENSLSNQVSAMMAGTREDLPSVSEESSSGASLEKDTPENAQDKSDTTTQQSPLTTTQQIPVTTPPPQRLFSVRPWTQLLDVIVCQSHALCPVFFQITCSIRVALCVQCVHQIDSQRCVCLVCTCCVLCQKHLVSCGAKAHDWRAWVRFCTQRVAGFVYQRCVLGKNCLVCLLLAHKCDELGCAHTQYCQLT